MVFEIEERNKNKEGLKEDSRNDEKNSATEKFLGWFFSVTRNWNKFMEFLAQPLKAETQLYVKGLRQM